MAGVIDDYLRGLQNELRHTGRGSRRMLRETEAHLHESVRQELDAGLAPPNAEAAAIERFGPVHDVGLCMRTELLRHRVSRHATQSVIVLPLGVLLAGAFAAGFLDDVAGYSPALAALPAVEVLLIVGMVAVAIRTFAGRRLDTTLTVRRANGLALLTLAIVGLQVATTVAAHAAANAQQQAEDARAARNAREPAVHVDPGCTSDQTLQQLRGYVANPASIPEPRRSQLRQCLTEISTAFADGLSRSFAGLGPALGRALIVAVGLFDAAVLLLAAMITGVPAWRDRRRLAALVTA